MCARSRRATLLAVTAALLCGCSSATSGHGSVAAGAVHRTGTFEMRPLVAPGAVLRPGSTAVPLDHLGFALPQDETQYNRLTAPDRARLGTALATTDCAQSRVRTPRIRVVCGNDVGQSLAVLTGAPVVRAADVVAAQAVPPSPAGGITQWTVRVTLDPAGRAALAAYSNAHNTGGTLNGTAVECSPTTTPCADFMAFVVGNRAVSLPVQAAADTVGLVALEGDLTSASARALARDIMS